MTEQDQRPMAGYPDSLGPDVHPGGVQEFGAPVPPYQGRKTHTSRAEAAAMASVFSVDYSAPAPRRKISKIERRGVPATDTTASSPLGVGGTLGRQGNERALKMSEKKRNRSRERHGIDPKSSIFRAGGQG